MCPMGRLCVCVYVCAANSKRWRCVKSHHDVKSLPLEPGPRAQLVGVELRGRVSHKFGFEDVAAKSVWQKAALVDLHLFGGSLEVQRHWEGNQSERERVKPSCWRRCSQVGVSACALPIWHPAFHMGTGL